MQLTDLTEIAGWVLVGGASARALFSAVAFAGRRWRAARLDREYITLFDELADKALKKFDGERQRLQQAWSGRRKFRIVQRTYENQRKDICSFYLTPYDNQPLPPFHPGQFLTFHLKVPGQPQPVVRCYSLSDSPTERRYYRITVKRLWAPANAAQGTPPGLASSYVHDRLQVGDVVEALAPSGAFCLDLKSQRPVVMVAGGVGLTPLVSMLNALVATRSRREIWFFYGVRNRTEHAMYDHLDRIRRAFPNVRLVVAYSRPTPTCRKGIDYDIEGHVGVTLMKPLLAARSCEFYVCGPSAMMDGITKDLAAAGVPPEDIKLEAFGAAAVKATSKRSAAPAADAGQTFRVEFARSGRVVQWTKSDGTLLELAEAHGVKARCGCRAGVCGTCQAGLRQGEVDYIQRPAREPGAAQCLPCITQPRSDVVLDI